MIIRGSYDTTLKRRLTPYVQRPCYCPEGPNIGIHGGPVPDIICIECYRHIGVIPETLWEELQVEIRSIQLYLEATSELSLELLNHPHRRCLMTNIVDPNIEADPGSLNYPDPSIIRTIPGHIIYDSAEAAALGSQCAHRWIIMPNGKDAKCLLCEGIRELDPQELSIIESAEQAGVQFLKWPERFQRIAKTRSRKRRSKSSSSKATGGVQVGTDIPEGYIPVKDAAKILGTDPKRLRKRIRSGEFEATKVGNRVYVRVEG